MVKFIPWLDSGTAAALGTGLAVIAPLIGLAIIQRIGFGYFLFYRPKWAITARPVPSAAAVPESSHGINFTITRRNTTMGMKNAR